VNNKFHNFTNLPRDYWLTHPPRTPRVAIPLTPALSNYPPGNCVYTPPCVATGEKGQGNRSNAKQTAINPNPSTDPPHPLPGYHKLTQKHGQQRLESDRYPDKRRIL
jgi:hypothetical protein